MLSTPRCYGVPVPRGGERYWSPAANGVLCDLGGKLNRDTDWKLSVVSGPRNHLDLLGRIPVHVARIFPAFAKGQNGA